ncbi:MAG: YceI family protein [Saprospiraceae bacterium]
MKNLILVLLILTSISTQAQRYLSKNAFVKFYSYTPLEKIEAVNNTAACVLDISTGNIEFSALNTAFQFKKALMQQHFNENYMESSKFPKAKFKGKIVDFNIINLNKEGSYLISVIGEMNMHGVTKGLIIPATLKVSSTGKISGESKFNIKAEDYQIAIPNLVKDNIAKEIEVTIKADLNKL